MAVSSEARPQLISLEDPNSIKCAISDAAQAERSGLSVIILSAQLKASPCNINTKHTEYQFGKHTTITLFWSVFKALSFLIFKNQILKPTRAIRLVTPPHQTLVLHTWGSDLTDLDIRGTCRAALPNATLQCIQDPLLWNVRYHLQVAVWNVELRPVVGFHALAGVSRQMEMESKKQTWAFKRSQKPKQLNTKS